MTGTLRWIFFAILLIMLGALIFTKAQSCQNAQIDPILDNTGNNIESSVSSAKAGLEDLYEDGVDKMSDLEKEAIKAKDKIATQAQDATNGIFEKEEDVEDFVEDASLVKSISDANNQRANITSSNSATNNNKAKDYSLTSSRRDGRTGNDFSEKYFVVVGSFLKKGNANEMKKSLIESGYDEAEVAVFDFSQYFSVFAKRTNNLNSARATAAAIKKKLGHAAYVHTKRSKYSRK